MSGGRWWVAVAGVAGSCLVGLVSALPSAAATTTTSSPITPATTTVPPTTVPPTTVPPTTVPPTTVPDPSSSAATATAHVSIIDYGFSPATITVDAGTTVTWLNTGASIHSVTSNTGAFDSSPSCPTGPCLDSGSSFSHVFGAAGQFSYHCRVHPNMAGTVVVTAPPPSTTTTTTSRAPGTSAPGGPPVSAGGTPSPTTSSPASTGPQLAFTGAPATEAWLALGALLTITVGLALRPRRRPFPIPVPVADAARTTEPPT